MKRSRNAEFKVYESFAQADQADYAYYGSLSGNQKLELMLRIMAPTYEVAQGFKRVYRVIERVRR